MADNTDSFMASKKVQAGPDTRLSIYNEISGTRAARTARKNEWSLLALNPEATNSSQRFFFKSTDDNKQ